MGGTMTLPATTSATGQKTEVATEMREARYHTKTGDGTPALPRNGREGM